MTQLCNFQRFLSSGSFKSGDGPDSFRRRDRGASRTSPTSPTIRASWRGRTRFPPVDSMDVKKKKQQLEGWTNVYMSKIVEEKKHVCSFFVDVSKMHITPRYYLKWLFWNCNSLIGDPLFSWICESLGLFLISRKLGDAPILNGIIIQYTNSNVLKFR